jgi:3-oxoacyl-[acyl-carrier protein] reductase
MKPLLEGKVAIVTGAARGIGAATASLFAQQGARLVPNDLDPEPLEALAAGIIKEGGEAKAVPGDVTAPELPDALLTTADETWGSVDILVNNAGYAWDGTLHKMSDEQWQAMLDVHLNAAFRLIRASAPYMRERAKAEMAEGSEVRFRKIVNVSSTTGTRGNFGQANYAAAKAGLIGLTKTMAKEWGRFNIQVNCAAFGFIDTRMTAVKDGSEAITVGEVSVPQGIPEQIRTIGTSLIPMGRPGKPEEAAGVLLFFASPLSNFVSGQVLEATGGT